MGKAEGINVMWDNKMNKQNNRPLSTGICVAAEGGGIFKSKVHGFFFFFFQDESSPSISPVLENQSTNGGCKCLTICCLIFSDCLSV